jgi:hypothetical protein
MQAFFGSLHDIASDVKPVQEEPADHMSSPWLICSEVWECDKCLVAASPHAAMSVSEENFAATQRG